VDNEVDLTRYSAGLRRHLRLIMAAAVVGAVLGLVVGALSPFTSSTTLVAIDRSAELAAAGVRTTEFDRRPVFTRIAAALDQAEFESTPGVEVDARAFLTESDGAVVVEVFGGSEADVDEAQAAVLAQARSVYVEEMRGLLGGIEQIFDQAAASAMTEIGRLEQQVASADTSRTALIDGLLVQIEQLRTTAVTATDNAAALRRIQGSLENDLVVQRSDTPERARPALLLAVAGAAVGFIVSAGAILLYVGIDKRIRSRRDLERIGLHDLVGTLSASPPAEGEVAILAGALLQAANRSQRTAIQLVPISGPADPELAARLQAHLDGIEIHARASLDLDAGDTMRSAPSVLSIVLVGWGRDDRVAVTTAVNRLAAASGTEAGVVLVGVPARELGTVER
jgi:hypothetical protein